jgi:lantibiotic modifying enzyme
MSSDSDMGPSPSPLLTGASAERALAALDEMSTSLLQLPSEQIADPSLSRGSAGVAIAHGYLDPIFPDRGHAARAVELLTRAAAVANQRRVSPWLYDGLTGVAWAIDHLTLPSDEASDDPNQAVDEEMKALLRASALPQSYELVRGFTGIGIYGLSRLPRSTALPLVELVVEALDRTREELPEGVAWRADAVWNPIAARMPDYVPGSACYDLGVAHGIASVICFLSALHPLGIERNRTDRLLRGAVGWLLAQRSASQEGPSFARYAGGDVRPHDSRRAAWCYGDPGISVALVLAARALGDPSLGQTALDIARRTAEGSVTGGQIEEASICHGAAGLAHIYHRLYRITADPLFAHAAGRWFDEAIAMRVPGRGIAGYVSFQQGKWMPEIGLLYGVAGIALCFAAALSTADPAWDVVLALSDGRGGHPTQPLDS